MARFEFNYNLRMKKNARVVVIGGGIGGLSTLYHLTQEGWSDVVLLERNELTELLGTQQLR